MKKLLLGKIIAVILIIGVVGSVSSLYFHLWNPSWNPFAEKPEVVLSKMTKNLEKVKTYHIEGNGTVNLKTKESQYSPRIEIEIKGDIDQENKDKPKSYSDIKGSLSFQGMSFESEIEGIGIGKTSYFKIKKFPVVIFSFYLGQDLSGLDSVVENKWVKVDQGSLKKFYESEGITDFPENKEKQKEMIEKIENLIKNKQWVKVKEDKGREEIDSKKCYHYLLSVNKEAIKQSLPEIIRIGVEYSPSPAPLTPQQINEANSEISKALDEFFQKTGDIDFDIWIGMKDKLPYKISFSKGIDMSKFRDNSFPYLLEELEKIDIKGEINFSDFGKKMNIQAPKESEDFNEFMKELRRLLAPPHYPFNKGE